MLEPKFSLKRPKLNKPTRIVLKIYIGEKTPFKYYLPISILPEKWDSKNKMAKKIMFGKDAAMINNYLDSVSSMVRSFGIESLNKKSIITKIKLKRLLDDFVQEKEETDKITFLKFIDVFIAQQLSLVAESRVKRYRTFKKHFSNFCKYQKFEYDFKDIDYDFYLAFMSYFYDVKLHAPNSTSGNIAVLKSIMKDARMKKIHDNRDYEDFKKASNKVTRVYLNDAEILQIWNTPSLSPYLEKTKHIFVFACLTGLRFSDFSNIKPHNIKEENGIYFLNKITKKTNEPVIVPVKKIAVKILKMNDYIMPSISNQKLNQYVKELCKIAEINQEISKPIYQGKNMTVKKVKKFELISSHTGRRSFCTNAFLAGVPTLSIMMMSGHTTESSFMKYICVTKEQNAEIISQHDFFKS